MKKKVMLSVATLGLVGLMAVPAFASEGVQQNHNFSWGADRQANIEAIADKVGLTTEDLLVNKEVGISCQDMLDSYGVTLEEIKEARLSEQFKAIEERVEAGEITVEQGQAIKESIESHRFLLDGNGPHQGQREGMQLNIQAKQMRNNGGRGPRADK